MTKTISLSDEAYEALASLKRPGESFSELARRLSRMAALDLVFDPAFRVEMSDAEAEAWKRSIREARDAEAEPRVKLP